MKLGIKIVDERSAWACVDKLHSLGPAQICITSTLLSENEGKDMIGLVSDLTTKTPIRGKIKIPIIKDDRCVTKDNPNGNVMFTGTGDMFAACLCGHSLSMEFHKAVGCALWALKSTLEVTLARNVNRAQLTREDIELNQVAARRLIMDSASADWKQFIQIIDS